MAAGTLDDLRARLVGLKGDSPVSARLEITVSGEEGNGDEPTELNGRAGADVGETAKGVTVTYDAESVANAEREAELLDGGSREFGARFALNSITAKDVHELLNAAPYLLRQIDRSRLIDEKDDTFDGKPARLLILKVTPRLNPQASKFIKDFKVTARIWLDGDGLPVAASIEQLRKGRAFLVIGFEANDTDDYRYRVIGDRLVAVRHERTTTGSGAGQKSNSKMVIELKPTETSGG